MTPDERRVLTRAIEELNEAAYQAGQSLNTDDAYDKHLDQHYALGVVHGIIRTIEEEAS